ncbi:hypothetical protein ACFL18_00395 [Patescibacteria group bacterium]
MKKNSYLIVLFLIIALGLTISILPILKGIFPITFDQGRDFLWVKNQIDFQRPSLIGPWGSLVGTFFGPLWFWLLALPYILSNGHPLAMTLFNALIVYSSVLAAAYLFYKTNKRISYFILLLGFTSPGIIGIANHAFSQHLLPLLTILFIYSLIKVSQAKSLHLILSALYLSLMYHSEPPMAIFSIPVLLIVIWQTKNKKKLLTPKTLTWSLLAFIIPFLPLIIFEFRYGFIQLKSILSFISGNNPSLKEIAPLSFSRRLIDRPIKFLAVFQATIFPVSRWVALFLLAFVGYQLKNIKSPQFIVNFIRTCFIYLVSLLIIFIFYPHDFKGFYLAGFKLIFIALIAIVSAHLYQIKSLRKKLIVALAIIIIINLKPISFFSSLRLNFSDRRFSNDIYLNQISVIDWIYQDAKDKGFKAYTFTPPIYDYHFQYLFFWRGLNQYHYLPEEFSYAPDQPEYVAKKNLQLVQLADKIKPSQGLVYLIINKGSRQELTDWKTKFNFNQLSLINHKGFYKDTIIVEKYHEI